MLIHMDTLFVRQNSFMAPQAKLINGPSIYIFKSVFLLLNFKNSTVIQPAWYLERCHGREGVTAVTVLHQAIVLTAGRQHGRVRRWRIVTTEDGSKVGLQLLNQVLKPSNLSWIESFTTLPSGEVLALGFLSVS